MPAVPTRVLIVDDDQLAVSGITGILITADDLYVVGARFDGDQVADAVQELRPDVVLCDMRMPRTGGVDVVRALVAKNAAPKFLMMTALDEAGAVMDAIAAGAAGFLMKDEDPKRIIEVVRSVAAGDAAYSPRAARQLTEWVQQSRTSDTHQDAVEKMKQLTDREREFALAVVNGASDAELAQQFYVAETTVKGTLAGIRSKWGVRTRTDVAVIVARSGA